MTDLTVYGATNNDDCFRRLTGDSWALGNYGANARTVGSYNVSYTKYGAGFRFVTVTVPKNATIVSAYLKGYAYYNLSSTNVKSYISAEAIDDAGAIADNATTFDARYATHGTQVAWDDISSWTAGTQYTSPDIGAVIQEIVNRAGWVSGKSILIFWEDFAGRTSAASKKDRSMHGYYDGAGTKPSLVITYTSGVDHPKTVTEIVGALDTFSTVKVLNRIFTELGGFKDTFFRAIARIRAYGDIIGASDIFTKIRGKLKVFTDILGASDSIAGRLKVMFRNFTDKMGGLDTASFFKYIRRSFTDFTDYAENKLIVKNMHRFMEHVSGFDDIVTKSVSRIREFTDKIGGVHSFIKSLFSGGLNYIVKEFTDVVGGLETFARSHGMFRSFIDMMDAKDLPIVKVRSMVRTFMVSTGLLDTINRYILHGRWKWIWGERPKVRIINESEE